MSALVRLVNVSKRYADAVALQSTNLSVECSKTTVLIGPSGCGKSTLLRLIIRLIEPDSGSIEFNGEVIRPDNIDVLRHRIGYVIQEGGLFPHLSARTIPGVCFAFLPGISQCAVPSRGHWRADKVF